MLHIFLKIRAKAEREENIMKNYKEYEKRFIGASDIAALILVGCDENGLKTSTLDFGEDGSYMAYVVDEDAEIGAHYKKVADFKHWLKIYDDDELTYRINAQEINIYIAPEILAVLYRRSANIKRNRVGKIKHLTHSFSSLRI